MTRNRRQMKVLGTLAIPKKKMVPLGASLMARKIKRKKLKRLRLKKLQNRSNHWLSLIKLKEMALEISERLHNSRFKIVWEVTTPRKNPKKVSKMKDLDNLIKRRSVKSLKMQNLRVALETSKILKRKRLLRKIKNWSQMRKVMELMVLVILDNLMSQKKR